MGVDDWQLTSFEELSILLDAHNEDQRDRWQHTLALLQPYSDRPLSVDDLFNGKVRSKETNKERLNKLIEDSQGWITGEA